MALYTTQTTRSGNYIVSKLDEQLNVQEFYIVRKEGRSLICSCLSHKPYCKHKEIITLMEEENKINTGSFYDFDLKSWHPPVNLTF